MILTEKQKAFCEHYAACLNATEAAKKAGYSDKTAFAIGAENLRKPNIQEYLQSLTVKQKEIRVAKADDVLIVLSNTLWDENLPIQARLKAAELLGKRYGLFVEKEDQTGDRVNVCINLKDCGGVHES